MILRRQGNEMGPVNNETRFTERGRRAFGVRFLERGERDRCVDWDRPRFGGRESSRDPSTQRVEILIITRLP